MQALFSQAGHRGKLRSFICGNDKYASLGVPDSRCSGSTSSLSGGFCASLVYIYFALIRTLGLGGPGGGLREGKDMGFSCCSLSTRVEAPMVSSKNNPLETLPKENQIQ